MKNRDDKIKLKFWNPIVINIRINKYICIHKYTHMSHHIQLKRHCPPSLQTKKKDIKSI